MPASGAGRTQACGAATPARLQHHPACRRRRRRPPPSAQLQRLIAALPACRRPPCRRLRWQINATPRIGGSPGTFDGISIYRLDRRGRVYQHEVTDVQLRDPVSGSVGSRRSRVRAWGAAASMCCCAALPGCRRFVAGAAAAPLRAGQRRLPRVAADWLSALPPSLCARCLPSPAHHQPAALLPQLHPEPTAGGAASALPRCGARAGGGAGERPRQQGRSSGATHRACPHGRLPWQGAVPLLSQPAPSPHPSVQARGTREERRTWLLRCWALQRRCWQAAARPTRRDVGGTAAPTSPLPPMPTPPAPLSVQ